MTGEDGDQGPAASAEQHRHGEDDGRGQEQQDDQGPRRRERAADPAEQHGTDDEHRVRAPRPLLAHAHGERPLADEGVGGDVPQVVGHEQRAREHADAHGARPRRARTARPPACRWCRGRRRARRTRTRRPRRARGTRRAACRRCSPRRRGCATAPTASSHHWPVTVTRVRPSTAARPNAANAAAFTVPGLAVPEAVRRRGPTRSTSVPRIAVGVVVRVVDAHLQGERDAERERGAPEVGLAELGGRAGADEHGGGGSRQRPRSSTLHPVAGSRHVGFLSSWRTASCVAARRSILPGPRTGSESVTTRWRGACAAPRCSVTAARTSAERGRSGPGAGDDDRDDRLPPLGVGHADDAHAVHARQAGDDGLDRDGRHLDPAADQDVVGPAQHRERSGGPHPEVRRAQVPDPVHLDERLRVEVRSAEVAVGEDRTGQQDPTVVVEPDRDAVERAAVVDAPAARLRHAVGGDHRDIVPHAREPAGPQSPQHHPAARRRRSAARRSPAASSRSRRSCVGTKDVYLRTAGRQGLAGRDEGRGAERPGSDRHRYRPGQHGADEHLQAGDVVRRQREHPVPGSAEPVVGGLRGRVQRGRGQEHGPRLTRGARRPHDGHDVVGHVVAHTDDRLPARPRRDGWYRRPRGLLRAPAGAGPAARRRHAAAGSPAQRRSVPGACPRGPHTATP